LQKNTTIIKAKRSWLDLELVDFLKYKDLLFLLIWRDFITSYKQTILGPFWVIAQGLFGSAIFTIVFSKVANISTDGHPAFLFYLSGMLGWQYFASVYGVGCNAVFQGILPSIDSACWTINFCYLQFSDSTSCFFYSFFHISKNNTLPSAH
jgi:hypothetical protein